MSEKFGGYKEFKGFKKIKGREVEVVTHIHHWMGSDYEIGFGGREPEMILHGDDSIRMWGIDNDPMGSEAEEVHNIAVELLERNMPLEEVFKRIRWLVQKVQIEMKRVEAFKDEALK
ncbi:hypothetical protein ACFLZX_02630 [Nanoarchaeota archaeon]